MDKIVDFPGRSTSPALPEGGKTDRVLVASWPKNTRETVQIALDNYKGAHTVDLRAWYVNDSGEAGPTRAGLTLAIRHLPALAEAVAKALVEAKERGLLP